MEAKKSGHLATKTCPSEGDSHRNMSSLRQRTTVSGLYASCAKYAAAQDSKISEATSSMRDDLTVVLDAVERYPKGRCLRRAARLSFWTVWMLSDISCAS